MQFILASKTEEIRTEALRESLDGEISRVQHCSHAVYVPSSYNLSRDEVQLRILIKNIKVSTASIGTNPVLPAQVVTPGSLINVKGFIVQASQDNNPCYSPCPETFRSPLAHCFFYVAATSPHSSRKRANFWFVFLNLSHHDVLP